MTVFMHSGRSKVDEDGYHFMYMPPTETSVVTAPMPQQAISIKYAGFWVRAAAILIDGLIVNIVFFILFSLFGQTTFKEADSANILSAVLYWAYSVIMVAKYQATLGKMAVGLRVERTSGEHVGWGRALLREVIGKLISGIILGIGYFMAAFTERKQGLHDKIADTIVVEVNPNKSKTVWVVLAVIFIALPILGILSAVFLAFLASHH